MNEENTRFKSNDQKRAVRKDSLLLHRIRKHWYKPVSLIALGIIISRKDVSIGMQFNSRMNNKNMVSMTTASLPESSTKVKAINTSMLAKDSRKPTAKAVKTSTKKTKNSHNLANTYSNLDFEKKKAEKLDAKTAAKRKKQYAYVKQYAEIAQAEMEKYGIPASIKLAQGLLESNVGESPLAVRNKNHFGIKCFSRTCKKGHCSNFSDDSHKDFFRRYKSPWESFRAHSNLLQGKRYRHLKSLGTTDYKGWAHGLKKAGYATDKRYAPKIIGLIENLQLYKYDY